MTHDSKEHREAFCKEYHPRLDLTEVSDAWGRPIFKHPHVESMWQGWREGRIALRSQPGMRAEGMTLRHHANETLEESEFLLRNTAPATLSASPADPKPAPDAMRESVEPEELENLIADRSANRAADAILEKYIVTPRSAPVPPPDGARNCVACNKPWIDGCWGGSFPDFSRCTNLTAPPSDDVRSALADKVEKAWRWNHVTSNGRFVESLSVDEQNEICAALRSAPVSARATVSDEDWDRALGCAYSCLEAPYLSLADFDNAMQHAFGILSLRKVTAPAVGVTREGLAEACIRRLARCNINNAGQREMAADDILSTLQKIEACPAPDATVSDWPQPFTTAPRDGTPILARCNDHSETFALQWDGEHWQCRDAKTTFGDGLFLPNGDWIPDLFQKASSARDAVVEGMVSGPYKYEKDLHACYRVSIPGRDGRLVACVYATAGEEQAELDAELFARSLTGAKP